MKVQQLIRVLERRESRMLDHLIRLSKRGKGVELVPYQQAIGNVGRAIEQLQQVPKRAE